ncbi:hypothetical protein ACP4OV_020742 [Aristida adscensionis]
MAAAAAAARFSALEAELAAKTSRIAELEARVSCLEAENARLRKAMANGEGAGRAGESYSAIDRLEEILGAHNQEEVEMVGAGAAACGGVMVRSDGEEGIGVDASKGRSPEEGGVVTVPASPKRGLRVVTPESVEGGSGSSSGDASRSIDVELEDDGVSTRSRGKKRATTRVVTSDSEDEDGDDAEQQGGTGSRKKRVLCAVSDSENEDGDDGVRLGSSGHTSCVPATQIERGEEEEDDIERGGEEEEDEDDDIPICQVLRKMRKRKASDDEFAGAKECSTPATRRSARLVKKQSREGQAAGGVCDFVEPREFEGSEDMDEDDDMDDFIVDDDFSENANDSAEESCSQPEVSGASAPDEEASPEPEESESDIDYADVMASVGRKRKAKEWKFEGEMLAAFRECPELCLKAVCALYRKQTEEEQFEKAALISNKQGFSHTDATSAQRVQVQLGSHIAEFLLDGDLHGPLRKTVHQLEEHDPNARKFCQKVASHYSKQLFTIYQNKEDPYFIP